MLDADMEVLMFFILMVMIAVSVVIQDGIMFVLSVAMLAARRIRDWKVDKNERV